MFEKLANEGLNFQGKRGVNAADPINDKDVVNLRTLIRRFASATASTLSSICIRNIGIGYPVYALNVDRSYDSCYSFRSLSAGTNLGMFSSDTITFYLNDNIVISGLTATTISAGTINSNLYLSAGTPIEEYFDRYWTASTGNQSVIRKFGNHSAPGAYSIVAGGKNHINNGNYSGIFAGSGNSITGNYSAALNGKLNTTLLSGSHSIISGERNNINSPYSYNTILNSKQSTLSYSTNSVIINGSGNTVDSIYNSIINGINNAISFSNNSGIFGGTNNTIQGSDYSFILFGKNNTVGSSYSSIIGGLNHQITSTWSSILGGSGNTVYGDYSAIIGGKNIIVNNNNTVAVPYLRIVNTPVGGTYMLTTDSNGYIFKNSIPGGGVGTISGATNIGGTHGIFANLNLGILQFKSLSGGSNIIISSSSTENAIALSPNVGINSLFVSGNTILSSTTASTLTVNSLSGGGILMVVTDNNGLLSTQVISGGTGNGTITGAVNTGSTHGIYAGLSGSSVLVFKSLSAGTNINIYSSTTENIIALNNDIVVNGITANTITATTISANDFLSGGTNLNNIFSHVGHKHPLTDILDGVLGDTIRHNGTNWIANNFLYNPGHKIGLNTTVDSATFGIEVTGSTTAETAFRIINSATSSPELFKVFHSGLVEIGDYNNQVTPHYFGNNSVTSKLTVLDLVNYSGTPHNSVVSIEGSAPNFGSGNTALRVRQNITGSRDAIVLIEHWNASGDNQLNHHGSLIRAIGGSSAYGFRTGLTVTSVGTVGMGENPSDPYTQLSVFGTPWSNTIGYIIKGFYSGGSEAFYIRNDATVRINSLTGATTQMVVADLNGILSTQTIPSAGSGGIGTITDAVNTGSTHGVYAGLSGSSVLVFKSLSGGSNIIITSSSTENAIALSPNIGINSLLVSGNTILSSTTASTLTVNSLSGGGTLMVVTDNNGLLSTQSIFTGTITGAVNTGSTHGIYAGLSGSSVLVFKSLSAGTNIIISSSSTENAIALNNNISINGLTANTITATTINAGNFISGGTNLNNIFSHVGHQHPLTDITGGVLGDTIRHNGTNWIANNFLYNSGHKIGINNTNLNSTLSIYSTGTTTATTSFLIYNNANQRLLSFWGNGLMELNPATTLSTDPSTPGNIWYEKPIFPSRLFVQDMTDSNSTIESGKTVVLIQGQINNGKSGNTALWVRQNIDGSPDAVAVFEHSNPYGATPLDNGSIIRVIGGRLNVLRTGLTINSNCLSAFGVGSVDSSTQVLIGLQDRGSMSSFNAFKIIDSGSSQVFNIRGDAQVTVRSLTGTTTQMVVANTSGVLSVQSIPSPGSGGFGTIAGAVNTGSTHGIYAGLSGSTVLIFKALSGGSNIIVSSSSTENAIALSSNINVTSLSADTLFSGSTNLENLFVVSGSSVGGGTGTVFKQKTGNFLEFKTINGAGGTSIINNTNTLTISSPNVPSGAYLWTAGTGTNSIQQTAGGNSTAQNYSFAQGKSNSTSGKYGVTFGVSNNNRSHYSFVFGKSNYLNNAHEHSLISAGSNHTISGDIAGKYNTISNGNISGLENTKYSVILNGNTNKIYGNISTSTLSIYSNIFNGLNNTIWNNRFSLIGTGSGNTISSNANAVSLNNNTILNGNQNEILDGNFGTILGGKLNKTNVVGNYSSILNGLNNYIYRTSINSHILGGSYNIINNVSYSTIINGRNYTLTESYTVLVPKLKIANLPTISSTFLLNVNSSGNVYKIGFSGGTGILINNSDGLFTVTYTGTSSSNHTILPGLNTYTGGTPSSQTVNVSALTINTLSASGDSIFSGQLSASTLTANTITATTISASTLSVNGVLNHNQFAYLSTPFSTTSSSLTDVTNMFFTIQPFEVWQFEISGQMSGSTINGQNHAISVPSGAILRAKDFSNTNAVTGFRTTALNASNTQSSTVGTNSNVLLMFELKGLVSGSSTSGNVQFRLKAGTAGDTETIQDGTYLVANRIK